ncbi:hypothetical protein Csa_020429 [Cucumis sativus]|uniref:Secreted protein n=1 Tax=Cucumis sativus TaxID=3659 RepID=A0A0A0K1M9_CUCSA|nr:hypothetical protein Csa_020429 [Cucumis sativus]
MNELKMSPLFTLVALLTMQKTSLLILPIIGGTERSKFGGFRFSHYQCGKSLRLDVNGGRCREEIHP